MKRIAVLLILLAASAIAVLSAYAFNSVFTSKAADLQSVADIHARELGKAILPAMERERTEILNKLDEISTTCLRAMRAELPENVASVPSDTAESLTKRLADLSPQQAAVILRTTSGRMLLGNLAEGFIAVMPIIADRLTTEPRGFVSTPIGAFAYASSKPEGGIYTLVFIHTGSIVSVIGDSFRKDAQKAVQDLVAMYPVEKSHLSGISYLAAGVPLGADNLPAGAFPPSIIEQNTEYLFEQGVFFDSISDKVAISAGLDLWAVSYFLLPTRLMLVLIFVVIFVFFSAIGIAAISLKRTHSSPETISQMLEDIGRPAAAFSADGKLFAANSLFLKSIAMTVAEFRTPPSFIEAIKVVFADPRQGARAALQSRNGRPVPGFIWKTGGFALFKASESNPTTDAAPTWETGAGYIIEAFEYPAALLDEIGNFISYNQSFLTGLGLADFDKDILRGITIFDVLSFVEPDKIREVSEALQSKTPTKGMLVSLFSGARARYFTLDVSHFESIRGITTLMTLQDITERKIAQDRLNSKMLELQNETRAKTHLLGIISHEIRNTLQIFLGETGEGVDDSARTFKLRLLHSLIDDILEFSRIEAKHITPNRDVFNPLDLVSFLESVFLSRASSHGLEFSCVIETDLPKAVIGDQSRITQILNNLISNAVKYVSGGKISMTVRWEGTQMSFRISDSGIGMTPEQKQRISNVFYRASDDIYTVSEGSGLGLAISRMLAEILHGKLDMDSIPGEGTSFTLTVPLEPTDAKVSKTPVQDFGTLAAKLLSIGHKPRVLVVEDDPASIKFYKALLNKVGVSFETADRPSEALSVFEVDKFDVVVTDDQMPGMNGSEFASILRGKAGDSLIIILLTGMPIDAVEKPESFDIIFNKPVQQEFWYLLAQDPTGEQACPVDDHGRDFLTDPDLFQILVEYVESLKRKIPELLKMMENGDWETLKRELHSIKGTAGSQGFAQPASYAKIAETVVASSRNEEEMRKLMQGMLDSLNSIGEWLKNNPPKPTR